tara:strand:+ start:6701 stop:7816 length:1116 start_codon:yes stop_codon:yes gene_type:complete
MVFFGPTFKPVDDDPGPSAETNKILSEMTPTERAKAKGGVAQKIKMETAPEYNKGECEEVLRSKGGNALIILGRDRPGNLISGYGGVKNQRAAHAIRLTAGMGGREVGKIPGNIDVSPPEGRMSPNNQLDAATIYLSQKTDIDDDQAGFNCAFGTVGWIYGRSAVAMKADSVRILSNDGGIKLITSANRTNSQGGNVDSYADINFIAGNDDSILQPLVKGRNMTIAVDSIFQYLDKIMTTINGIVEQQNKFNTVLTTHTHPVPPIVVPPLVSTPGIGAGVASWGGPVTTTVTGMTTIASQPLFVGQTGPTPGMTEVNPAVSAIGSETTAIFGTQTKQRIVVDKNNMWSSNFNFTHNNNSKFYLLSKNVHTT